jgi:mRNA interferase YafQ
MKQICTTSTFDRDLKRAIKRQKSLQKLQSVVKIIATNHSLPAKYRPHKLNGEYFQKWECHIEPDWLLIYEITEKAVILYRTGSHADLF